MNEVSYRYVDESSISPSLFCPICLEVLNDPYIHLSCESAFCHRCLIQLDKYICPICRTYWAEFIPYQGNCFIVKANRLIRNLLDDLSVECSNCKTIYRRADESQHRCSFKESSSLNGDDRQISVIFSRTILLLSVVFIYQYRSIFFQSIGDSLPQRIHPIARNIDQFVFHLCVRLVKIMIDYRKLLFTIHLCFWLSLRWTRIRINKFFKRFLEVSICFYLLFYLIPQEN